MNTFVIIIVTVLVFGVIIMIHELGHFTAAKLSKFKVNEFSLGMGPTVWKHQKPPEVDPVDPDIVLKEYTKYSLRLLPIGGFVSVEGEDEESEDSQSYLRKPLWQRFIFVVAGAVMNLILGFVILCCVYSTADLIPTRRIAEFNENASSQSAGLQEKDEILQVNGRAMFTYDDIVNEIYGDDDGTMDFVVKRGGKNVNIDKVKFKTVVDGEKRELDLDFKFKGEKKTFLNVVSYSAGKAVSLGRMIWISLGDLVTGKVGFDQLSGPVGVGKAIGEVSAYGASSLFIMVAFLSINVGIFNLLPLPALDGGRLIFILIEAIFRRPVPQKYEAVIHAVGLFLLFGLMIVITFKDVIGLFQ